MGPPSTGCGARDRQVREPSLAANTSAVCPPHARQGDRQTWLTRHA
jgi:hypothetical protein